MVSFGPSKNFELVLTIFLFTYIILFFKNWGWEKLSLFKVTLTFKTIS